MKLSKDHPVVIWGRRIGVFVLVCFAWLFFRANSMQDAIHLIKVLFTGAGAGLSGTLEIMNLDITNILMCVLSIDTLIIIDRVLKYEDTVGGSYILTKNASFIYYVWMIMFAWAILLSHDMASTFIYFQF